KGSRPFPPNPRFRSRRLLPGERLEHESLGTSCAMPCKGMPLLAVEQPIGVAAVALGGAAGAALAGRDHVDLRAADPLVLLGRREIGDERGQLLRGDARSRQAPDLE